MLCNLTMEYGKKQRNLALISVKLLVEYFLNKCDLNYSEQFDHNPKA